DPGHAEFAGPGLGWLTGCVLLPHARRRLHTADPVRMAELAVRTAPDRCVVLDDGVRLEWPEGGPALPGGARVVNSRLAINRLKDRKPDDAAVDRFLARHQAPIVEQDRCTFLWRGEADDVRLVHRIVGLPDAIPLRRVWGTDLWYLVLELPAGSRLNYQLEVRRGEHHERMNDPLNPKLSYSPVGTSSVCFADGYTTPDWTEYDPDARPGTLTDIVVPSRALRRDCEVTLYLPARF